MSGLRPYFDLVRERISPRLARLARLHASTLHPLAPSHMHLRCALRIANLEKRA